MKLTYQGGYSSLIRKLNRAQIQIPKDGAAWAERCARSLDRFYRHYLSNQGRGGAPPPLADLTKRIYDVDGQPDGSGIRKHIEIEVRPGRLHAIAIWGIPEGKPAMVARVQDRGATIAVTAKMRGFLAARYGIFLRASTKAIVIPARRSIQESFKFAQRQGQSTAGLIIRSLRN